MDHITFRSVIWCLAFLQTETNKPRFGFDHVGLSCGLVKTYWYGTNLLESLDACQYMLIHLYIMSKCD